MARIAARVKHYHVLWTFCRNLSMPEITACHLSQEELPY